MTKSQILEGQRLLEALNVDEAEAHFQALLDDPTHSLDAKLWLSRIDMLMRGNVDKGFQRIEEVLNDEPNHAEALALKGVYFLSQEKPKSAVVFLEKAQKAEPSLPIVCTNLSICYRQLNRENDALQMVKKSIEYDPNDYKARYELSQVYLQLGQVEESMTELLEVISLHPHHLGAYVDLGSMYKIAERYDMLVTLFEEAVRINPGAYFLRRELAETYCKMGEYEQARGHSLSLGEDRGFYGDFLHAGLCSLLLGDGDAAEKAYLKSIDLEPSSWEGYFNLGELYAAIPHFDKAREFYEKSIERGEAEFKPLNGLGLLFLHEKKPHKAKEYLQKALDLNPRQLESNHNMALACAVLEEWKDAETFVRISLALSGEGSPVHEEAIRLLDTVKKNLHPS